MKKLIFLLLAGAVVTLAACGGGGETTPAAQPEAAEETTAAEEEEVEAVDVSGEDELKIEIGDFFFEPALIRGEAGQKITFVVGNEGDAPHTFTSEALGADESLKPGKEVELSVTFPDSGSAEFHCEIHPDMTGSIEVAG